MWTKTKDGSVLNEAGEVIFFSTERFLNDIALGDCCFLCGAKPDSKEFNNEHILPRWLLKRYNLFDRTITLPNGTTIQYGSYTVPCCEECNSLMGTTVETPISEIVKQGCDAINDFIRDGGLLKIYVWMGLIFLKAHLKDTALKMHRDQRLGDETISQSFDYDWSDLHHLHSLVRCFVTNATVEREAVGSFLTLPVNTKDSDDKFDLVNLTVGQAMLLRLDNISLYAVFDDSGAAMVTCNSRFEKITGPVNTLQMREVISDFACANIHLKDRPTFMTQFSLDQRFSRIVANRPPAVVLHDLDKSIRGSLLFLAVDHALNNIRVEGLSKPEIADAIKGGDFTFLFNKDGSFIEDVIITNSADE